jgi:FMN phosphatase YigB (HAD superfamily)
VNPQVAARSAGNVAPPFRAVSLDLWFTTIFHSGDEAAWNAVWGQDRALVLSQVLRRDGGRPLLLEEAVGAIHRVQEQLRSEGTNTGRVDPGAVLLRCAALLGADLASPLAEASERFSSAGLAEHPPGINAEAVEVVHALQRRRIPVIMITNSRRRGSSWRAFLSERAGLDIPAVVSPCELGVPTPEARIFEVAADRLGLRPSEILHVGDRWELDVEGAVRAGFGAALYRGLWPIYPKGMYPPTDPAIVATSGVRCIDTLEELLADGWFETPPQGGHAPAARGPPRRSGPPPARDGAGTAGFDGL